MINAKVKYIISYPSMIDREVNNFLQTIDVRQIIKIDFVYVGSDSQIICLIMYLELADIRESKIESILDKKQI
jgi:hypothetical protein